MKIQKTTLLSLQLLIIPVTCCTDEHHLTINVPPNNAPDTGFTWEWGTTTYSLEDVLAQCLSVVTDLPSETLCEGYLTESNYEIYSQENCQEVYNLFSSDIANLTASYSTDTIDSIYASVIENSITYFVISSDDEEYLTVPSTLFSISFVDMLGHSIKCSTAKEDFSEYGLSESYTRTNLCYMLSGEGTLRYYDSYCRDPSTNINATNYVSIIHMPNLEDAISNWFFSNYSNITISSGLSASYCDDFIDDGRSPYSPSCPGFFTTTIEEQQVEYSTHLEMLVLAGDPIMVP